RNMTSPPRAGGRPGYLRSTRCDLRSRPRLTVLPCDRLACLLSFGSAQRRDIGRHNVTPFSVAFRSRAESPTCDTRLTYAPSDASQCDVGCHAWRAAVSSVRRSRSSFEAAIRTVGTRDPGAHDDGRSDTAMGAHRACRSDTGHVSSLPRLPPRPP